MMTDVENNQLAVYEMHLDTYKNFQALIYDLSGIALSDSKRALLMNRIAKRMRYLKIETPEQYLVFVENNRGSEVEKLIDVVSTNVTHFFREQPHFDYLKSLCHTWNNEGKKSIKIWCAAASSGQEPYSIAMTLFDNLKAVDTDIKILATDICSDVLLRAVDGSYDHSEISNIPGNILLKHFEKMGTDDGYRYLVHQNLKNAITYKRLNLADFPYPLKGQFDAIFCRNVMIYFDRPMRQKVIDQFYSLIRPGGHLILSHSENLLGINHSFISQGASVYIK